MNETPAIYCETFGNATVRFSSNLTCYFVTVYITIVSFTFLAWEMFSLDKFVISSISDVVVKVKPEN